MKTIFLTIMMLSVVAAVKSNDPDKYTKSMKKAINEIYEARTPDQISEVVNKFERIAKAEPEKWHPLYYAAYGNIMIGATLEDKSKVDPYLDKAQDYLDQARELEKQNAEIATLQGFIHMMRVVVDPPSRGPEYSGMSFQAYGQALGLDPENPRALALMGQMKIGQAQFFGQDTSEGCGMVKKAVANFESWVPEHELDPIWGKEMALSFLNQSCKGNSTGSN